MHPLAQGHRLVGRSLLHTGHLMQGRTHLKLLAKTRQKQLESGDIELAYS